MPFPRTIRRTMALALLAAALARSGWAQSDPPTRKNMAAPWGVSASASSFKNHAEWFPKMAAAGVTTVRLFPEWRGFELTKGTWNWQAGDLLVRSAARHHLAINAVLMGSPPGTKEVHAFPMEHLDDWSTYVAAVVGRYQPQIRHWEVWNEGNGGFNDGKHTTADYAKLAIATYEAAKRADPQAQVGLTVASFDAPYLNQTILAMSKSGQPNRFDYLCIHPYEIADGLGDVDGEIPLLWMTRLLRDMLKRSAPDRANAEIWISEIGQRIEKTPHRTVTEQDAARSLAKIYTIAIAQGVARTQWFEAQDPVGEDQGFGLLHRDGSARPAYQTLTTLASTLGATPKYLGWLALGSEGRGYGFVFDGPTAPMLVAWMPKGLIDRTIVFASDVQVTRAVGSMITTLKAGSPLELTDEPIVVAGVSTKLVDQAKANANQNFPWGGDYSQAKSVSFQAGFPDACRGVFPVGRVGSPTVAFADGSAGILLQGDINHPVRFYAHPSFANINTKEYYFRATVRRVAPGNVGMNLLYEVADSQGRMPYANVGQWFGVSDDPGWQSYTWHVSDACLSKMWGFDFMIRAEQSVPFVLGKIEVSTEKFP